MKQSFLPLGAVLGDPAIDTAHDLVFEVLQKTLQLPVEQFRTSYGEVVKGMEMDFRREEELMENFQCPDSRLHREQHARMLAGLHHAGSALQQGDDQQAYLALHALAEWLPFHIATQDRHLLRAVRERRPGQSNHAV
jgi:hemerythrin-like metal-binding protein